MDCKWSKRGGQIWQIWPNSNNSFHIWLNQLYLIEIRCCSWPRVNIQRNSESSFTNSWSQLIIGLPGRNLILSFSFCRMRVNWGWLVHSIVISCMSVFYYHYYCRIIHLFFIVVFVVVVIVCFFLLLNVCCTLIFIFYFRYSIDWETPLTVFDLSTPSSSVVTVSTPFSTILYKVPHYKFVNKIYFCLYKVYTIYKVYTM